MRRKKFEGKERQIGNPDYGQYLYQKYKVEFSRQDLCFYFNGESYTKAHPLLTRLHKIEMTEAYLNTYVLAIFLTLLGIAIYGVNAIDSYVQSFR